jgi:hypothetical protein
LTIVRKEKRDRRRPLGRVADDPAHKPPKRLALLKVTALGLRDQPEGATMACSGKNYDRRSGSDLPCGRIVMARHEDGTEWCATHDPRGDFAKKNAAFAQRAATASAPAAPTDVTPAIASASAYLTLPQLQRELSALFGDQARIPTTSRKLEQRRY